MKSSICAEHSTKSNVQSFRKLGIKDNFLNLLKNYKNPIIKIILYDERLFSSLRSGISEGCLLLPLIFSIVGSRQYNKERKKKPSNPKTYRLERKR